MRQVGGECGEGGVFGLVAISGGGRGGGSYDGRGGRDGETPIFLPLFSHSSMFSE